MYLRSRISRWSARAGVLGVLAIATTLQGSAAAVLPVNNDNSNDGGARAGILLRSMLTSMAGEWTGKTPTGKSIRLVLRLERGLLAGTATFNGALPDSGAEPLQLVKTTLTGRTMAFQVQPCAKSVAYGAVTFVSEGAARLDLQAGSTPITVRLSRVG
jgi:hypothetical protein